MEPVRPSPAPVAPQAVAKVVPLGKGWMLALLEAGPVLRHAGQGVERRVTPEQGDALRQGQITPEALLAQGMPPPPPAALTVAFSEQALRLAGLAKWGGAGGREPPPRLAAMPAGVEGRLWLIGAVALALLVLVLWTA